jgi:hypothetical protein
MERAAMREKKDAVFFTRAKQAVINHIQIWVTAIS